MCGEPLRAPYVAATAANKPIPNLTGPPIPATPLPATRLPATPRPPVRGISGPSILGIGDDDAPSRSADYLLDEADEPHTARGVVYTVLLLILGVVAFGAWRWRQAGYPWEKGRSAANSATAPVATPAVNGSSTPADSSSAATPGTNPATPATTDPSAAATAVTPPAAEAGTTPAAATPNGADNKPVSPPEEAGAKQAIDVKPAEPAPEAKAPDAKTPEAKPAPSQKPSAAQSARKSAAADTDEDDEGDSADSAPAPRRAVKPDPRQSAANAGPALDPTDAWVTDGQKYLYGSGVPQDCRRAKAQLLAAAGRSNSTAQSTLGTMYATGHCVDRDYVSAYRWFAQALQKDHTNTRLQQDLQVLWNQMTPQEKAAATQSRVSR